MNKTTKQVQIVKLSQQQQINVLCKYIKGKKERREYTVNQKYFLKDFFVALVGWQHWVKLFVAEIRNLKE